MSAKAVVEAIQRRPSEIGFVCALGLPLQIPGIVPPARVSACRGWLVSELSYRR
jgi:hypothetical protein